MKIIISATHSVGKSTLFENLRNSIDGIQFLPEIARDFKERGLIKSVGITCSHNDTVQILEQHYKNVLQYNSFISDRGALDAFVYATQNYLDGAYTYKEHLIHEDIFLRCVSFYDKIIYIPLVSQPFVQDSIRDSSEAYRENIDSMFKKLISLYGLKNIYKIDNTDLSEKNLLKATTKIITE